MKTKKPLNKKQSKKFWHEFDKALESDKKYFVEQVEKGIKRLVGHKTSERELNCCHCELWSKSDKFIREVLKEK